MLLMRADSKEALLSLRGPVRAGGYGDAANWHMAEDVWFLSERSLATSLTMKPTPFPIELARAALTSPGYSALPWLEDFYALPESYKRQRSRLARMMLSVAGIRGSYDGRTLMSDMADVAAAASRSSGVVGIGILQASEDDPSDLVRLLDSLPARIRIGYRQAATSYPTMPHSLSAQLVTRLARHALDRPSARSLEVLAVALASTDERPAQTIALKPNKQNRIEYAAAAFIAFVTQDRSTDPQELGRRFASSAPASMWRLLHSPVAQTTPDWAEFLVGAHQAAPGAWGTRAILDRLAGEALSWRDTPLADASTWSDLSLFSPHPLTLAQ